MPSTEFVIRDDQDLYDMFKESTGRRIATCGAEFEFSKLPFAGRTGEWELPNGKFLWVGFDDGAYWLIATPSGRPTRYHSLVPLTASPHR